jgi:phosphatidylinositol-3-phosphatase
VVRRPPVSRAAARGAIAVLITTLVLSTSPASGSAVPAPIDIGALRTSRPPVVVIVLENHEYGSIESSPSAPYLKAFARGGTLFTRFHALHHPSLPNYLEMTSGQTSGCRSDDCPKQRYRSNNLFKQLSNAGVGWASWAESMGSRCRTSSRGDYASWHNPALYYRNLKARACPHRDVPYPKHLPRHLPRFVFAVPNLCHDMHDCSVSAGNHWLKHHVPPLLHHGATVIITFDEGVTNRGGGGHIYTAMRGRGVPRGKRNGHTYSHRGLLAGLERHYGVRRLNGARKARPFPIP